MMFSGRRLRVRPTLVGAITNSFLNTSALSSVSSVAAFGSNPGALKMRVYAPARLRAGRPLVVVLHGCRQDAASFANDAGWIAVAQRFRLALLLPEQTYENNKGRCFNWFRPEDVKRGSGEVMSIRQMLRHATRLFGSDPKRIFVTGFSAGGRMAAALIGRRRSICGPSNIRDMPSPAILIRPTAAARGPGSRMLV